jgi:hypothetical protein
VAITARGGGARRRTRGGGPRAASRSRPADPRPPAPAPEAVEEAAPPGDVAPIPLSSPEPVFAARVLPPAPPRPLPTARRAIFLDVENTSRPQHLAHIVDHLAVNRGERTVELVAVGNWRVVSHESARLLAQRGAHLVHSAPSTGVRDWSDLRIAVTAGIWLAGARPGDTIEIVSDDRAFDVVGDVAASLGVDFQRLSYRRLLGEQVPEVEAPRQEPARDADGRSRRRRGGRGRARPHGPARGRAHQPRSAPAPSRPARGPVDEAGAGRSRGPAAPAAPVAGEPHTAPHDEIVAVIRGLVHASPSRSVSLDFVANALKSRGFRRSPGSPRLVTRLRRIREFSVSPSGMISLAEEARDAPEAAPVAPDDRRPGPAEGPADDDAAQDDDARGNVAPPGDGRPPHPEPGRRRRRRRWRGGRRRPSQPSPA